MNQYPIQSAVSDLSSIFTRSGYTTNTVTELKRNIQKVVNIHQENRLCYYSDELVERYISMIKDKYNSHLIGRNRRSALIRAALYVREFAITGTIQVGAKEIPDKLTTYYRNILEELKSSSGI